MARDFPRSKRVAQQIQRELVEIIRKEIKDPRLGLLSLTDVVVSKDLGYADVFVSAFGDGDETAEAAVLLGDASGYLRHLLGKEMRLRTIPHLRFHPDTSIADGIRMSAKIDAAIARDESTHVEDPDEDSDLSSGTSPKSASEE